MVRSQTKPKSSKEAASKDKDKEKDKTKAKKPDGKDAKGAKAKPGKQPAEPRKAKALDPARTALIAKGKEKGFLTYEEVNDAMPEDVIRTDQIDSWMSMFSEHGIDIVDASARRAAEEADADKDSAAHHEATEVALLQMKASGDPLTTPRRVDHVAYFDDADDADACCEELCREGFEALPLLTLESGQFLLQVFRHDPLQKTALQAVVKRVREVTLANRGIYDGWETAMAQPRAALP